MYGGVRGRGQAPPPTRLSGVLTVILLYDEVRVKRTYRWRVDGETHNQVCLSELWI